MAPSRRPEVVDCDQLWIEAWPDPLVEALGHTPGSAYSRRWWLPIIGPSTLLAAERLTQELAEHPDGFRLDVDLLGRSLGVGGRGGRHSTIVRTLTRLTQFGLARYHPGPTALLRVRTVWPPLTRRQLERVPDGLEDGPAA